MSSYALPLPGGGTDPNDRRQKLINALLGRGGPGQAGAQTYGARPLFGGYGRGSAGGSAYPEAALPSLDFNPFAAQQARGFGNLASPTHDPNFGGMNTAPPGLANRPPDAGVPPSNGGGVGGNPGMGQGGPPPGVGGPPASPQGDPSAAGYGGLDAPNQWYAPPSASASRFLLGNGPQPPTSSLPRVFTGGAYYG